MSRQYIVSGKCVEAVLQGKSFKAYCSSIKLGRVDYALACETLKYMDVLKELFKRLDIVISRVDVNIGIFFVMAFELLFGKKKVTGGGAVKRKLCEYKALLEAEVLLLLKEKGFSEPHELISQSVKSSCELPKYIRVNELKMDLLRGLQEVKTLSDDSTDACHFDVLIPSLIALPAKAPSLGESSRVKSGSLIIQDKASCFPSQVLSDIWQGGDIIDATAAPGNKTSHMASEIFKNKRYAGEKIFAFDKGIPCPSVNLIMF